MKTCMLLAVVLITSVAGTVFAEDLRRPPKHVITLTSDEENETLRFPIVVVAEPVREELYVVDSLDRAIIYTSDFFPIFTIGRKQGLQGIQSLVVDRDGYVYVAIAPSKDTTKRAITVLSPRLKVERDILITGFKGADGFQPYRMAIDSRGTMYVAGLYQPQVVVLDPKSGAVRNTIVVEEGGKEVRINGVSVDRDDNVYLVSEDEGHVYVYDRNLTFLFRFGDKGGSSGKLSRPMAVAVDEQRGLLIVSDFMRHTILIYAKKDGKFISEFGGLGWGEGWFQHQRDVTVDSKGRIVVADSFNNRVQILEFRQ